MRDMSMSTQNDAEKTSDKMIDGFKDKAEESVDDARNGKSDDNPLKETIRDEAGSDEGTESDKGKQRG